MRLFYLLTLSLILPCICLAQTISNYDTCRTPLYFQRIGDGLRDMTMIKARTVKDQGIISAGNTSQAGFVQAQLSKQGMNGELLWIKNYGGPVEDERITDWRELTNGDLVVAGTTRSKITLLSNFFLMRLAANGDKIWQKIYYDITPFHNIHNAKIFPDYEGNYFFAAQGDSTIIYGSIANTGEVLLQRTIRVGPGTKLMAALSVASNWMVATSSVEAGYQVASFYHMNRLFTGTDVRWSYKFGGPAQNSSFILHDYEQYGQYSYFTGLRSVAGGPWELVRLNMNQANFPEALEKIGTPGIVLDSLSRTVSNLYGDVVSFTEGRKNNKLHAVQLAGSNFYPSAVNWSKSFQFPDSIVLAGTAKTWDAGYNFMGLKELPGNNKQLLQLKTDSSANPPTCIQSTRRNFSVERLVLPNEPAAFTYNNQHSLAGDDGYNLVTSSANIDTLVLCRQIKCPEVPLTDSCLESFQKLYRSYNPGSLSAGMQIINGRIFMAGASMSMDYATESQNSFITEINKNGQVLTRRISSLAPAAFPACLKPMTAA